MDFQNLPKRTQRDVLRLQKTELTAHKIYTRIADRIKDDKNATVVREIADEELKAHDIWRGISGREVSVNRIQLFLFGLMHTLLGITFTIKF